MMLLEEIFKSKKALYSDYFNLRIHRGLSWLKKSRDLEHDLDFRFISLWICFHSIYANDTQLSQDKQSLNLFLHRLCSKDQEQKIYAILLDKHSQNLQIILDYPYIYQGFWDYQNQKITIDAYREGLNKEKQNVQIALQQKSVVDLLFVVFNRLSTLNNQLTRGGATYTSPLNRKQLQESCTLLSALLSAFIYILLENAESFDLGKPFYPAVQVS